MMYKKLQNTKYIKYGLITLVFLLCGVLYFWKQGMADKSENCSVNDCYASAAQTVQETVSETATDTADKDKETAQSEAVFVYVCGSVNTPGVYCADGQSRIFEIIEQAGGFSDEADTAAVNLADTVKDGQKIYIPKQGETVTEAASNGQGEAPAALVNINTAGKEELMKLPGIGEAKAADIITYRTSVGKFKTIEDIKNISGIKESAFQKFQALICV